MCQKKACNVYEITVRCPVMGTAYNVYYCWECRMQVIKYKGTFLHTNDKILDTDAAKRA